MSRRLIGTSGCDRFVSLSPTPKEIKSYAFDSNKSGELRTETNTKAGNVLVETFYRSQHFDVSASCSHEIDNNTSA